MSEALAQQLYRLYTAQVYPVLALSDPIYKQSLMRCGLGWNGDGNIGSRRDSFEKEMKIQAWLAAQHISDARSLEPNSIRANLLTGPFTLYRVANSTSKAPPGIWWFTEKVAARCRDEAGPKPQDRLDWLRNVLAVCYNWSAFDKIERLNIRQGESIPVVIGKGLPMPHYKIQPYFDRKTGQQMVTLPDDVKAYWASKGQFLFGGELQTVLPWVPVRRVDSLPSL
jgi:hypothetical protein